MFFDPLWMEVFASNDFLNLLFGEEHLALKGPVLVVVTLEF